MQRFVALLKASAVWPTLALILAGPISCTKDQAASRRDALPRIYHANRLLAGVQEGLAVRVVRGQDVHAHANDDVTDGYAHAELAEMVDALVALPSPLQWGEEEVRATRTTGKSGGGSRSQG